MQNSVLGSIGLGYQPLWNAARNLCGFRLFVQSASQETLNPPHLLEALHHLWSGPRTTLLVSPRTPELLCGLLEHAMTDMPMLEVHIRWLADPEVFRRVKLALAQGLPLVWQGELPHTPSLQVLHRHFPRQVVELRAEEALKALQVGQLHLHTGPAAQRLHPSNPSPQSPVQPGQVYENLASHFLVEHALDHQRAAAVAGWPVDDVMHEHRQYRTLPRLDTIQHMLHALNADESMESVEAYLCEDPALAYRFMIHANSAAHGLRTGVDSLRHGLMMLGYTSLKHWLQGQLSSASVALNLKPVFSGMVMRAKLLEHLLDAGAGGDLQRELYLCGLFSQLDVLLGEPMHAILARLPLSERVVDALLHNQGPYADYLQMARLLETPDTAATLALCEQAELSLEEVNRVLMRVLDGLPLAHPALWA